MDAPYSPDLGAFARELSAAHGVIARARRTLTEEHLPQLQHLVDALERIHATLGGLSAPERAGLQRQLLAVVDEAAGLVESLSAEHARTQAALRRAGTKRQADRAYRRTGGL